MDSYEATRVVFSRIQNIDPENASKVMGLLLIQDHGEKEMIRLAFGPETLVHSVILKARKDLGLNSNSPSSTPSSTPSSPSPFFSSNPITISRQNSTSRLSLTIPNPSSSTSSNTTEDHLLSSNTSSSSSSSLSSTLSSSSLPFYQNGSSQPDHTNMTTTTMDEFNLQDQLSFLNDNAFPTPQDLLLSSSPTNDNLIQAAGAGFPSPYWPNSPTIHRRSCSVSDMCLAAEDPNSAFGWKPCLYFARGFCKNGTSCRFLHGDDSLVGSPGSKLDAMIDHHHHHHQCNQHHNQHQHHHHHHELLRSKSVQQQRLVSASSSPTSSQLMANSFPYSPKCMNLLLQNESQRAAATALMMGSEDLHKFGRTRLERSDFALNGGVNPASRQIYLTFPADSTFREEDVSNYFSIYGPVQDVRIPYQQKRMFGFVTFVYPETVKLILAKGNPHFVCDARVLVKPYKEKGKVHDKKQQQSQVERGDFSPCGTPTGLDSRDPFDLQLGARMFYNSQDVLWRRKLEEQAELQQALELQSRRLMSLQLLDVKKHHHRALSTGSPIQSPTQSPNFFSQNLVLSSIHSSSEVPLDQNCSTPTPIPAAVDPSAPIGKEPTGNHDENGNGKESPHDEIGDLLESLEHNLPDSPFASPTKGREGDYNHMNAFSAHNHVAVANEANDHSSTDLSTATSSNMNLSTTTLLPSASTLDMASFKSFNCQLPRFWEADMSLSDDNNSKITQSLVGFVPSLLPSRFSSGHGAIGMYAGTTAGGPKCPVGI